MKYLKYIASSLVLMFVPIYGLLISVATAIALDTFTGVFKSVKLDGWASITSRNLSNILSKLTLYETCIIFLFVIDKFLLNEFIIRSFGIQFMFTKICCILLIFVEMVSIKENVEKTFGIEIWEMLSKAFKRAKIVKKDIEDIT